MPSAWNIAKTLSLQDQLARLRRRARGVVLVVEVDVVDLPSVDSAVGVHVLEVRVGGGRDLRVSGRGRPGERLRAADRHLGRGDPRSRGRVGRGPLALPQAAVSSAAAPPTAATAQVLDLLISGRMRVLLVLVDCGCWMSLRRGLRCGRQRPRGRGSSERIRVAPRAMDAIPPAIPRGNTRIATMSTMP